MNTTIIWIVAIIVIGGLLFFYLSNQNKGSRQIATTTPSVSATIQQPNTTHIQKNNQGTLSLVTLTPTGQVVSSRVLGFEEAVRLIGSYRDVCGGRFNAANAYSECATIRIR